MLHASSGRSGKQQEQQNSPNLTEAFLAEPCKMGNNFKDGAWDGEDWCGILVSQQCRISLCCLCSVRATRVGAISILKWKGCKKQLGECVIQFWVQKKFGQRTQKKKFGIIMKTDVLLQFKIGILKQHYTTYNFDTFTVFS